MTKRTKRILAMMSSKPKLRKISGLPPLTYTAKEEGTLKNYRIYGQTVDGESVGDLVTSGEHAGEYKVPVTVEGKNLFDAEIVQGSFNNSTGAPTVAPDRVRSNGNAFIFLNSGIYTINANGAHDVVVYCYSSNDVSTFVKSASEVSWRNLPYKFTANAAYYYLFAFRNATNSTIAPSDVSNIMLNTGPNPLPYEPYHTPITTPIYLPEPIKMVGDEAEYIEYGTQKMYRIGADDLDVTLPALPTVTGTNVLSVGTEVQPSEVKVTGRIRSVPTGGGE